MSKTTAPRNKKPAAAPQAKSAREVLGVKGDLRIDNIAFNPWLGRASFSWSEGEQTDEGFAPMREMGSVNLSGESYAAFMKLEGKPGEPVSKTIRTFLMEELLKTLEKPAQVQQR